MNDVQAAENLVQEIKQIIQQYQIEVGSKGKPWPKSVKTRVFQLIDLGFTLQSISDDTGIPYYSILNWRHRRKEKAKSERFQELALTPNLPGSVAVAERSHIGQPIAAVTVTTPGGYRIEAGDVTDVIKILKAMGGG